MAKRVLFNLPEEVDVNPHDRVVRKKKKNEEIKEEKHDHFEPINIPQDFEFVANFNVSIEKTWYPLYRHESQFQRYCLKKQYEYFMHEETPIVSENVPACKKFSIDGKEKLWWDVGFEVSRTSLELQKLCEAFGRVVLFATTQQGLQRIRRDDGTIAFKREYLDFITLKPYKVWFYEVFSPKEQQDILKSLALYSCEECFSQSNELNCVSRDSCRSPDFEIDFIV